MKNQDSVSHCDPWAIALCFMLFVALTAPVHAEDVVEDFGPGQDWLSTVNSSENGKQITSPNTNLTWAFTKCSYSKASGLTLGTVSLNPGKTFSHVVVTLADGFPEGTKIKYQSGSTNKNSLEASPERGNSIIMPDIDYNGDIKKAFINSLSTYSIKSIRFVNMGLLTPEVSNLKSWTEQASEAQHAVTTTATVTVSQPDKIWIVDEDGNAMAVRATDLLCSFKPGDVIAKYYAGKLDATTDTPTMIPDINTFSRLQTKDAPAPLTVSVSDVATTPVNTYVSIDGLTLLESGKAISGNTEIAYSNPYQVAMACDVPCSVTAIISGTDTARELIILSFTPDSFSDELTQTLDFSDPTLLSLDKEIDFTADTPKTTEQVTITLNDGVTCELLPGGEYGVEFGRDSKNNKEFFLYCGIDMVFNAGYSSITELRFHHYGTLDLVLESTDGGVVKKNGKDITITYPPEKSMMSRSGESRTIKFTGGRLSSVEIDYYGVVTSIDSISINDREYPIEYYSLDGRLLSHPTAGSIVIEKRGPSVRKIIVR